jgi:hypothetical protein
MKAHKHERNQMNRIKQLFKKLASMFTGKASVGYFGVKGVK